MLVSLFLGKGVFSAVTVYVRRICPERCLKRGDFVGIHTKVKKGSEGQEMPEQKFEGVVNRAHKKPKKPPKPFYSLPIAK
jgi:hypothetical protein